MAMARWKPPSQSGCEKRVRVQFDDSIDLREAESARRILISLPPSLTLVADLATLLRARLSIVPLQQLSVSIDGFLLPYDQELHRVVRDNDLLFVREELASVPDGMSGEADGEELCEASSPPAKRSRRSATPSMLASDFSPGTLDALDVALVGSQTPQAMVSSAAAARASQAVLASHQASQDRPAGIAEAPVATATALQVDPLAAAKAAALERAEKALATAQDRTQPEEDEEDEDDDDEDVKEENKVEDRDKQVAQEKFDKGSDEHRVFVGGLPWSVDEDMLRKDFSECGEIVDLHLMKDKETGGSRGMAFISFADVAGFNAAVKFDGDDYGGRRLKVCRAENKKGGGKGGKGGGKGKGKGKKCRSS